jgi:hypothetical protein
MSTDAPTTPAAGQQDAAGDYRTMLGMVTGYWVSQTVAAFAELSIPELLNDGPRSYDEVAEAVQADEAAIRRLLRAGVTLGLVVHADGKFVATPLLDTLRSGSANSLRHLALSLAAPGHWLTWGLFSDAVRHGGPRSDRALGNNIFDYFGTNPEEAGLFSAAMTDLSTPIVNEAVLELELAPGDVVVDVGGANGAFVHALMEKYPKATGVVLDLPHIVSGAEQAAVERGLSDRFSVVGGDFFEAVPPADVYLLKYILHDWDDESAVKVLQRCREAMDEGGRVAIVEIVLGDTSDPGFGSLMDLNMLAMTGGRERDLAEFDELLASAGLRRTSCTSLQPPYAVIEAEAV